MPKKSATPPSQNFTSTPIDEGELALDIYQTGKEIIVIAPIAGVKESNLQVIISDEVLTIKGKRIFDENIAQENYFTKECFWGTFSRTIVLPENIDTGKIVANFKDGILVIKIPKTAKVKTKVISIKTDA